MQSPAENEQLTALAGLSLFFLLAAEGVTLLFLRPLLPEHIVIGLLLVPPVLLKLAATGWRFLRYYTGRAEYVRRGPPQLLLRLLAPVLVLSTLAVLGSGIALVVVGPGHPGVLLALHKASFVVWGPTFGVHVLAYLRRVPRLALAAPRAQQLAVAALVGISVVAALATYGDLHPSLHWFDGGRLDDR